MTLVKSGSVTNKDKGFAHAAVSEKHERVARQSLHDIIVFYQALEKEIQAILAKKAKGVEYDAELLERMSVVKEKYHLAMDGFLELSENEQRHVLMVFADSIQDLMKYVHGRRKFHV